MRFAVSEAPGDRCWARLGPFSQAGLGAIPTTGFRKGLLAFISSEMAPGLREVSSLGLCGRCSAKGLSECLARCSASWSWLRPCCDHAAILHAFLASVVTGFAGSLASVVTGSAGLRAEMPVGPDTSGVRLFSGSLVPRTERVVCTCSVDACCPQGRPGGSGQVQVPALGV